MRFFYLLYCNLVYGFHISRTITRYVSMNSMEKFQKSWYVVGESENMKQNVPKKITVWSKDYVLWKNLDKYYALEDVCKHRGVALSSGKVEKNEIICPYHGYKYDSNGNLTHVPGIKFKSCKKYNIAKFMVVEKNGWLYMNTYEIPEFAETDELEKTILYESESKENMSHILLNQYFNAHPRIVSENSLDIMHIGFVHTFGNRDRPAPYYEDPPKKIGVNHWRTKYIYESGGDSMISKVFHLKKIEIENEFILPHTTIARIKFGESYVNTIVTAACPINERETKLFVKNYRNFFIGNIFDRMFYKMMVETLLQDKAVVETIKNENMDGNYNMKYDKLQNTYTTLYKNQ